MNIFLSSNDKLKKYTNISEANEKKPKIHNKHSYVYFGKGDRQHGASWKIGHSIIALGASIPSILLVPLAFKSYRKMVGKLWKEGVSGKEKNLSLYIKAPSLAGSNLAPQKPISVVSSPQNTSDASILDEASGHLQAIEFVREDPKAQNTSTFSSQPKLEPQNIPALPVLAPNFGGFANGGNTCYVGSTLQLLRLNPLVNERIAPDFQLTPFEKESPGSFDKRQQIQALVRSFLVNTNASKTVPGIEMKKLEELILPFHEAFHGHSSQLGGGGMSDRMYQTLLYVLGIPKEEYNQYFYPEFLEKKDGKFNLEADFDALKKDFRPQTAYIVRHEIPLNFPPELTIETTDGHRYALVALACGLPGHEISYLRDHSKQEWVKCDDDNTKERLQEIPVTTSVHGLVYVRL